VAKSTNTHGVTSLSISSDLLGGEWTKLQKIWRHFSAYLLGGTWPNSQKHRRHSLPACWAVSAKIYRFMVSFLYLFVERHVAYSTETHGVTSLPACMSSRF
jgi:hypothetical protein